MESGVVLGSEAGFVLAFLWGFAVAAFMRGWDVGRFMSRHMMWFVVATGAGVDLFIVWLFFTNDAGLVAWIDIVGVFFFSSLVIAGWSIMDLTRYLKDVINGLSGE